MVWRRTGSPGAPTPPANAPAAWKHFVIESTYLVPLDQLDTLLAAHRAHLGKAFERGLLLASGPQEPRTGGMILARAKDNAEIDALLAADPFQKAGYSRYRVIEFVPVKQSAAFDAWTSAT
ncbi:MAG: GTP cyclohydrolase [Planctomycetes bacterium]|nr:GTP cyclohydrolase [Planctomycetota bacterium]